MEERTHGRMQAITVVPLAAYVGLSAGQAFAQKSQHRQVLHESRTVHRAENFRWIERQRSRCVELVGRIRLLRRYEKAKTEKAKNSKERTPDHGAIQSQNVASASKILKNMRQAHVIR